MGSVGEGGAGGKGVCVGVADVGVFETRAVFVTGASGATWIGVPLGNGTQLVRSRVVVIKSAKARVHLFICTLTPSSPDPTINPC